MAASDHVLISGSAPPRSGPCDDAVRRSRSLALSAPSPPGAGSLVRRCSDKPDRPPARGRSPLLLVFALAVFLVLSGGVALAAGLQDELKQKKDRLGKVRERQGILTTELEAMGTEISRLQAEVKELRAREASVEAELAAKQRELEAATAKLGRDREHLAAVRARLQRELVDLRQRLVSIYETGTPDVLSTILSSEDLAEVSASAEYLNLIQKHDRALVNTISRLRDRARATVASQRELRDQVAAARDGIAAQAEELQSTRGRLEEQAGELVAARANRSEALAELDDREAVLEGDVSDLQAEIQAELAASASTALPSAPSSSPGSFIWPINGTLTSPFGYRWGRQHEGIDVGAAEGTPIWAAAGGTVVLQQSEYESGGYGNYTCLEHSSGLTTCYAHQSAFEVGPGEAVSQGEVIGLVGNTGNSFGAHLHFEVRVGGVAQDPLGYL